MAALHHRPSILRLPNRALTAPLCCHDQQMLIMRLRTSKRRSCRSEAGPIFVHLMKFLLVDPASAAGREVLAQHGVLESNTSNQYLKVPGLIRTSDTQYQPQTKEAKSFRAGPPHRAPPLITYLVTDCFRMLISRCVFTNTSRYWSRLS